MEVERQACQIVGLHALHEPAGGEVQTAPTTKREALVRNIAVQRLAEDPISVGRRDEVAQRGVVGAPTQQQVFEQGEFETAAEYRRVKMQDEALRQFERWMQMVWDLNEGRLANLGPQSERWVGRLDPSTIKALTVYVHSLGGGK